MVTYRELQEKMKTLSEEQLDMPVTVLWYKDDGTGTGVGGGDYEDATEIYIDGGNGDEMFPKEILIIKVETTE